MIHLKFKSIYPNPQKENFIKKNWSFRKGGGGSMNVLSQRVNKGGVGLMSIWEESRG